jgi:hypothetical protein
VYGAFGLIALLAIAGAAFVLIQFGQWNNISVMTTTIIGLGVIIMAGYYVIGAVSATMC